MNGERTRGLWSGENDGAVELSQPETTGRVKPNVKTGPRVVKASSVVSSQAGYGSRVSPEEAAHAPSHPKRQYSRTLYCTLAFILLTCMGWTMGLALFNAAPDTVTNHVMNTTRLDEGSFWRFIDLPRFQSFAVTGLVAVFAGYAFVLGELVFTHAQIARLFPFTIVSSGVDKLRRIGGRVLARGVNSESNIRRMSSAVLSFSRHSSVRQRAQLAMKVGDLAVETVMMVQILEAGTPIELVVVFTVIVCLNAFTCAILMYIPQSPIVLSETLVDLLFDVLIVVGYPVLVICYCLSLFSFDRAKYAINLDIFAPGYFERSALAIADPVERAIIYKSLTSLRISSVLSFFTRIGVNVALCVRLHRVVVHDPAQQQNTVYPKRQRLAVVGLVLYAVLLIIFVQESTRTSASACSIHPECAVFAKRWTLDKQHQCPCLIMIDCDFAPKTYTEWLAPRNVTMKVANLAGKGLLQTVQLTNRYLPVLPIELRQCTDLRYVSLMYTHTSSLPDWFEEFTNLEYLHVEGTQAASLLVIPARTFDAMPSLTFLHFGLHPGFVDFPLLRGSTNLKSLTIGALMSLKELPSFDNLHQLERLVISATPLLDRLPDLAGIKHLRSFSAFDRGAWCCNGYLGICDLQNPLCMVHPVWGTPEATCLPPTEVASRATLELAAQFSSTICGPVLQLSDLEPPLTESMVTQCNGTLYKQCDLPGLEEAMCYNLRMTVLSCTRSPLAIQMRRRQIQLAVGSPCNPEYEAWLGCK